MKLQKVVGCKQVLEMESSRGVSVFYCDWDTETFDTKEDEMNETSVKTDTDEMSTSTTNVSNELTCDTQQASSSTSPSPANSMSSDRTGQPGQAETLRLCGWLSKQGAVGFVKTNKLYWFVFGDDTCKLYYYRNRNDLLPQGEIDISKASFSYNVNKEKLQDGVLEIRSESKTHYLDAQDRSKMIYWLQELQRKRREYSQKRTSLSTERMQLTIKKQQQTGGLLSSKPAVTDDRMKSTDGTIPNLVLPGDEVEDDRITAPMKPTSFSSGLKSEILNVISSIKTQSPTTSERHSPPPSPRSGSSNEEWSILEPDPVFPSNPPSASSNSQSPSALKSQTKFLNTLKKMKIGKRTSSDSNIKIPATAVCVRCKHLYEENVSLKDDLRATEEELQAHREIVKLLQKEIDTKARIVNTSSESVGKDEGELLEMLKDRDKHIVELEHCLSLVQEEKSTSVQQTRQLESECASIKEHSAMLQEMLMAKNEIIEKLTSQIYELENSHGDRVHTVSVTNGDSTTYPSAKEVESLKDACAAYEIQNKFLSKEILELNELRHFDMTREKMILIDTAKLEGDFLQTRSKYLYLLKELEKPKLGGEESEEAKKQEVINQLLEDALESEKTQRVTDRRQLFLSSQSTQEVDKYGFQKWVYDDDVDLILARAGQLQHESDRLTNKLKEAEEATSHQVKWENFMVGQSGKYLTRSPELKTLIRLGIPHEYREQIWRGCINLYVGETKSKLGPSYYKDLVQKGKSSNSAKQIELDLLRTLPTNVHFESLESDGIKKLRHVLLAYSMHNQDIGYCQGLNRLVAIALLFLTEEESFWCLVAIVDYIMPKDYYTKTLAAAQADQRVLKDLIQEKLPKLFSHFEMYDVDLSLFTFNWFLTVFVDNIPPDTFLKVWDSFLYEGSKVMFRFAIAFLKLVEDDILIQTSSLAINRYMRVIGDKLTQSKRISQIAFHDLNPFPMRTVSSRRLHHLQQVRTELAELDIIRQKFSSKSIPEDRKDYYDEDEDDEDDEEELS